MAGISGLKDSFKLDGIPTRFAPSPGEQIDHYRVDKHLGGGTYGDVYRVTDTNSNQVYALKVLKLYEIPYTEAKESIGERFRREFICGQIKSEHIVHSYKLGIKNGNPYIVMDYCPNGDLRAKVKQRIDFNLLDKYAIDILIGLRDLHGEGIIHRDLKPDNVMLTSKNKAVLADFGITGFVNHSVKRQTRPDMLGRVRDTFGTYAYIAPEQLVDSKKFKTTCPVTDIFSFGAMMYEMITGGHLPFGALDSDASLAEYIKNLHLGQMIPTTNYRSNIPQHWNAILKKSLDSNYSSRFQKVEEILSLLGARQYTEPVSSSFNCNTVALKVMNGFQAGMVFNLSNLIGPNRNVGLIRVGRLDTDTLNQVSIDDPNSYVSRRHATIERHENPVKWIIRDGQWDSVNRCWTNSLNGTFVNSSQVDSAGITLAVGDIITMGDTTLKVINPPA